MGVSSHGGDGDKGRETKFTFNFNAAVILRRRNAGCVFEISFALSYTCREKVGSYLATWLSDTRNIYSQARALSAPSASLFPRANPTHVLDTSPAPNSLWRQINSRLPPFSRLRNPKASSTQIDYLSQAYVCSTLSLLLRFSLQFRLLSSSQHETANFTDRRNGRGAASSRRPAQEPRYRCHSSFGGPTTSEDPPIRRSSVGFERLPS